MVLLSTYIAHRRLSVWSESTPEFCSRKRAQHTALLLPPQEIGILLVRRDGDGDPITATIRRTAPNREQQPSQSHQESATCGISEPIIALPATTRRTCSKHKLSRKMEKESNSQSLNRKISQVPLHLCTPKGKEESGAATASRGEGTERIEAGFVLIRRRSLLFPVEI